jgi:uncharacterized protein YbbC (DUF1343 family)
MFERYTEKARRVIFFARYEASQFGTQAIETEHLLLGILREDHALLRRFISRAQSAIELFRKEIEGHVPIREKFSTSVELPLSSETKRVLAYAHEESDRLQHRHIGTEHMLLGLLRENGSLAAQMLFERGLSLEAVRKEIAQGTEIPPAAFDGQPPDEAKWAEELRTYSRRLNSLADFLAGRANGGSMQTETHVETVQRAGDAPRTIQGSAESFSQSGGTGRRTVLGIEKLLSERQDLLRGARVGLVCNQASVNRQFRHVADLMWEQKHLKMTALFGPQHGIRGDVQDNMVETPHGLDALTGLPVHSLYSETREPTEEMLKDVDALVFDMQDVGCRIYTFVYTLANCMRAAGRYGKRVIVCDRPNPLGGEHLAGTILEPEYASFVGQFALPTRHGMTVCELAQMFKGHWGIDCELEIVPMDGWSRDLWFDQTDAPWVLPSPNMPTLDSATVFPGTVHLEGTQMSEGRGTTRPFELIGAPYIEASVYERTLEGLGLPGVSFRGANFLPTFQKHAGATCGGVQIHVTDRRQFEPVITGVAAVKTAYDLYTEQFRWKEPPYEYVFDKNPFDVIAGTRNLRDAIERGDTLESIAESWQKGLVEFTQARQQYLLY